MTRVVFLLAVVVLAGTLAAGCVDKRLTPGLDSTIKLVQGARASDYHWPAIVATDAHGLPVQGDLSVAPMLVQSLLPGQQDAVHRYVGLVSPSNPSIDYDSKGAIYVNAVDRELRSFDHGQTWATVREYKSPNTPTTDDRFLSLFSAQVVDHENDRLFQMFNTIGVVIPDNPVTGIHGSVSSCPDLASTTNQGDSWRESLTVSYPASCHGTAAFGQMLLGKPGPDAKAPGLGTSDYGRVLYVCPGPVFRWVLPLTLNPSVPPQIFADLLGPCRASWDAGDTFTQTQEVFTDVPSVGGMPCTTASLGRLAAFPDGTIAAPLGSLWFNESYPPPHPGWAAGRIEPCPPRVAISRDSGLTWNVRQMPHGTNHTSIEFDPQITVTPDGTAYYVYRALDESFGADDLHLSGAVFVTRSKDQFKTWEEPIHISPLDHVMDVAVSITSGSDGHIAVGYIGTKTAQDRDSYWFDPATVYHLFIATTANGGDANPTFLTQQVTPNEDPVCVGPVTGCVRALFATFPLNVARDGDGRVYASFTDACVVRNACTRDVQGAFRAIEAAPSVAVQATGRSLFEGKTLEPLRLTPPIPQEE